MMSTFNINIPMFYPPRGRKKWHCILVSNSLKSNYDEMVDSGHVIESELLSTGEVAVSLEDDDGYVDLKVSGNKRLDTMVEEILSEEKWRDKITS